MLNRKFYQLTATEEKTVEFLQSKGLLPDGVDFPPYVKCGGETKEYTIKRRRDGETRKYVSIRCRRKGCQATQFVCKDNAFFTYFDRNGKAHSNLSLAKILEIAFCGAKG